ncbi:MAG: hypothetical protein HN888_00760 [Desulfobacula sp.]|nr:hypothetical protein [Desulfobacula sp.]
MSNFLKTITICTTLMTLLFGVSQITQSYAAEKTKTPVMQDSAQVAFPEPTEGETPVFLDSESQETPVIPDLPESTELQAPTDEKIPSLPVALD